MSRRKGDGDNRKVCGTTLLFAVIREIKCQSRDLDLNLKYSHREKTKASIGKR